MPLKNCPECNKEISDRAASCPHCGYPLQETTPPEPPPITPNLSESPSPPTKKKRSGCLIPIIIFLLIGCLAVLSESIFETSNGDSASSSESDAVKVVLDTMQFWVTEDRAVSEQELIEILGEPDSIEEWNYDKGGIRVYPIRTLCYGNYRYNFNSDMLQRISIDDEEIPYSNKEEILAMFGLEMHSNSDVTDTGFAYRVTNCGVPDFWVAIMDEDSLDSIRISYGPVFID